MKPILTVIQGGKLPITVAKKDEKPKPIQWLCNTCYEATGITTSTTIEIQQNPIVKNGKVEGGVPMRICLNCLLRGTLTRV